LILYLDTSTLLKLYVEEQGSWEISRSTQDAAAVATSRIAYAEARAALARARRSERLSEGEFRRAKEAFEADWSGMMVVEVSDPLVRAAADLVERHPLRGFDAIHLASALTLRQQLDEPVTFSAWDAHLLDAARAEGLAVAV